MASKEPVLLIVLIETTWKRWYTAGVKLDGQVLTLMCSEPDNLADYVGAPLDEQVSFLRHRLSGVLQRGCDRLWGRGKKPCHIVFLADAPFDAASPELTRQVAEHFVQWMVQPPVVFFLCRQGFAVGENPALDRIAGDLEPERRQALESGYGELIAALRRPDAWEVSQPKPSKSG